jgi:hypothetical protein
MRQRNGSRARVRPWQEYEPRPRTAALRCRRGSAAACGKASTTGECQHGTSVRRDGCEADKHQGSSPNATHAGDATAMRAYAGHRRHRSSVPGSDVRVEHRRLGKRLRADPSALKQHAPHEPLSLDGSVQCTVHAASSRPSACDAAGARRSRCGATAAVGRARRAVTGAHAILAR